jgi:hypothetical protein
MSESWYVKMLASRSRSHLGRPTEAPGRRMHFDQAFCPGRQIADLPIMARWIMPMAATRNDTGCSFGRTNSPMRMHQFPVSANEFPVPQTNFPVPTPQGIGVQRNGIAG